MGESTDIDEFKEYVQTVVDALSDKVRYWITFNEPACFIGFGYFEGSTGSV